MRVSVEEGKEALRLRDRDIASSILNTFPSCMHNSNFIKMKTIKKTRNPVHKELS
jgi:hypothetical protein